MTQHDVRPASTIDRLRLYRASARVLRLHTVPPLHAQSDGEHTFGVLCLLDLIHPEPGPSVALWRRALQHDVPEAVTGDVPSPMLHQYPKLREAVDWAEKMVIDRYALQNENRLTALEQRMLKFCDRMELALFSVEEADSGNIKMLRVYYRVMNSLKEGRLLDVSDKAYEIYEYLTAYVELWYGDQSEKLNSMLHGTPNE